MNEIFTYLGIDDKVKFHRGVKHPLCDQLSTFIKQNGLGNLTGHAFSCTREQYTIIKSAYLRGVNSLMIIEDDCWFYKDIDELQQYFDNLPDDWDILRVNSLRGRTEEKYCSREEYENKLWVPVQSAIYGTGCYCMTRTGMKAMIDWIDKNYDAIDMPLWYYWKIGVKMYIPKRPLALCFPEETISDINVGNQKGGPQYYYLDIEDIDLSMYKY